MPKRIDKPEFKLGLRYLEENSGMTSMELAEALGIDVRNALKYIELWKKMKLVCIIEWRIHRNHSGHPSPVYGIRNHISRGNAPKPIPMSNSEKARRYRDKVSGLITARNRKSTNCSYSHDFLLLGIKR